MEENDMFEEKESFWKKKGFYISACTLLVAIIAVGAVYYQKTSKHSDNKLMADIATEMPDPTAEVTATPDVKQDTAQTNAKVSENISAKEDNQTSIADSDVDKDNAKRPKRRQRRKKRYLNQNRRSQQRPFQPQQIK